MGDCELKAKHDKDEVSNPGHPFAMGITLEGLHARSTDEFWEEAVLSGTDELTHKLVTLNNLSIYWVSMVNVYFVVSFSSVAVTNGMLGYKYAHLKKLKGLHHFHAGAHCDRCFKATASVHHSSTK